MLAQLIDGWNAAPGAPKNWDPSRDGECEALPIRVTPHDGQVAYCESAWKPTPEELEILNRGGLIILRVHGWQPPVALYVEEVP